MKLSIIIPTAGRPVAIRAAIQSLLAVSPAQHATEILVVDNNTDESFARDLHTFCAPLNGQVRYVREPNPGLTAARHRGIRESRGEILTFIDDDVEVSDGWLDAIQLGFSNSEVGMIGGPSIPKFTDSVPSWFWDFLSGTPHGGWMCPWLSLLDIGRDVESINPIYVWGLNFSIRRSIVERCGGFNPDLVPSHLQRWQGDGETGLALKIEAAGMRADFLHKALLFHRCGPERLKPDYFKKRAFYQGVADSFTRIRSGDDPQPSSLPTQQNTAYRNLRAMAGKVVRAVRGGALFGRKANTAVWDATKAAHIAGWRFHQTETASDPRLLAWVRRADFMDADIRRELSEKVPVA